MTHGCPSMGVDDSSLPLEDCDASGVTVLPAPEWCYREDGREPPSRAPARGFLGSCGPGHECRSLPRARTATHPPADAPVGGRALSVPRRFMGDAALKTPDRTTPP